MSHKGNDYFIDLAHEEFMEQDFPRIKQPKPEFPEVQKYKPLTDEEEQEIINKVNYSIHEKGAR